MAGSVEKISGIILAAGAGIRMGETKQLLPFNGTPILEHVIRNALRSHLDEIIVVIGHDADRVKKSVNFSGTKKIVNTAYLNGHSSSLIKGLENISKDSSAALFLLGDQPLISFSLINKIMDAFMPSGKNIGIPFFNKKRGNPVIIRSPLFDQLKSLSGDSGPRVLFRQFQNDILDIQVNDGSILIDIDTRKNYEKLISDYS